MFGAKLAGSNAHLTALYIVERFGLSANRSVNNGHNGQRWWILDTRNCSMMMRTECFTTATGHRMAGQAGARTDTYIPQPALRLCTALSSLSLSREFSPEAQEEDRDGRFSGREDDGSGRSRGTRWNYTDVRAAQRRAKNAARSRIPTRRILTRGAEEGMTSRGNSEALHLETSKLHLELSAALKEDVSRKKTDEMKKRAIHTAASYDEFRHMVSCAQLTPITRKEMEMLSDQKRGWQGRSGGVVPTTQKPGSSGRKKAARSTRKSDGTEIGGATRAGGPARAPRDYSQFQRDWRRRCRSDDERREYLRMICPDKLPVLFRVEMEPDILGQVLSLICGDFVRQPAGHEIDSAEAPMHQPGGGNARSTAVGSSRAGNEVPSLIGRDEARKCVEWLSALSRTGRFAVNILFLEDKEKLALGRLFDLIAAACHENSDEDACEKVTSLRKAYAV